MKKLLTGGMFVLAMSGCSVVPVTPSSNNNLPSASGTSPVACTMEAKICPDGSSVGRTGPNCEFAVCPNSTTTTTTVTSTTSNTTSTPATTPAPTPTSTPSDLQTYSNSEYHFQFQYPKDFALSGVNYANLDKKLVQVQLAAAAFPKSNFDDAAVAVSTSAAKSEKDCLAIDTEGGNDGFKDKATINGQEFYLANGGDAGAGNFYQSKTYRAFKSPTCYEITETVHTSNIGNFDPGTVTEVDQTAVWKKLDDVLNTFKFVS